MWLNSSVSDEAPAFPSAVSVVLRARNRAEVDSVERLGRFGREGRASSAGTFSLELGGGASARSEIELFVVYSLRFLEKRREADAEVYMGEFS
jgi:hypothetical protein